MIKYFFTLTTIFFTSIVVSQEKPEMQAKTYETEDGKFYVQKAMPIYLFISNSPVSNSRKYKLKSKETASFTNPMYFDADGFNSLRTKWAVNQKTKQKVNPLNEIIYEVYADSKAPETYGLFNKKAIGYENNMRIYPIGTKLTILDYDAVVGTESIYYSINEKPYIKYTEPIVFNDEITFNIKFFGADYVGNAEEIHSLSFIVK